MSQRKRQSGFTISELLMALLVASVVLSAVVTLASATTRAKEATDQMGREQSERRQVLLRISDLVMRSNRVFSTSESGFWMWHDTNADGLATNDELTQIVRGGDGDTITIGTGETYSQCENVSFGFDAAGPDTKLITVWFDLDENGVTQRHAVTARLRVSDEHRQF